MLLYNYKLLFSGSQAFLYVNIQIKLGYIEKPKGEESQNMHFPIL